MLQNQKEIQGQLGLGVRDIERHMMNVRGQLLDDYSDFSFASQKSRGIRSMGTITCVYSHIGIRTFVALRRKGITPILSSARSVYVDTE